ncbi:MAG: glycine cleavage system protein GcvH [Deinococcota bacterium]|jgi:glycine cleavage system H protein|nr:glycine cleavage system protein GcvH [Deinococcota bacterium]
MEIPADLKYAASHEWSRLEDDVITVGITDFAQDQLGDVVFIELPQVGKKVKAGEAVAVIESVKTASDIYAPVSGEITEINESLIDAPERVNEAPYGDGWMFRLRVAEASELKSLLDAATYLEAVEEA